MGFLNKKPVIRQEGFHPLELNEDNVRAIFNRCSDSSDFICPKEWIFRRFKAHRF